MKFARFLSFDNKLKYEKKNQGVKFNQDKLKHKSSVQRI